jgi:3-hydroxyisobutyrate dehydrogenase
MSTSPHVTVLGTGRMGAAMAARLVDEYPVVTWSRSNRVVPGVRAASALRPAVEDADVLILAVFDAEACRAVLAECLSYVSAAATVVNTVTVGPHEAQALADLVRAAGRGYVHAPVLGSVRAVAAGELVVLAGGSVSESARAVLATLGTVLGVGDPSSAASLKLVAAGALGDCLYATRDALRRARAARLDMASTLAVLERSPLSSLVRSKRGQLVGDDAGGDAEFTVAALAKDLGLLASASGHEHRAIGLIENLRALGALADGDDIARLCLAPGGSGARAVDGSDAQLTVAHTVAVEESVLEPLRAYALGHATGDAVHFRRAFWPTAHVEGNRDGEFVSWDLERYCALFNGPAPDEAERRRRIDWVTVAGSVAAAGMTLDHGPDTFTDMFVLVRHSEGWRIANKVYQRRPPLRRRSATVGSGNSVPRTSEPPGSLV